jgi:hypothetical protein
MTQDNYVERLEQTLFDVITNLQEDIPEGQWSTHLSTAVIDAYVLLAGDDEYH